MSYNILTDHVNIFKENTRRIKFVQQYIVSNLLHVGRVELRKKWKTRTLKPTVFLSMRTFRHLFSYRLKRRITQVLQKFDICGSMHHSIIHIEDPTRCNSVSKFYFIFIWSSTCFGRHTAHHQEPKTALAASGSCIRGRMLDVKLLDAVSVQQLHVQQPCKYARTRGC